MPFAEYIGKDAIRKTYYNAVSPPIFLNAGERKANDIIQTVQKLTKIPPRMGDSLYDITIYDCLLDYFRWWREINYWLEYRPEKRDCDNFAGAWYGDIKKWDGWCGSPSIIVWGCQVYAGIVQELHAFNLFVCYPSLENPELTVYKIEPQLADGVTKLADGEIDPTTIRLITL